MSEHTNQLMRAIEHIEASLSEAISIEETARRAGMSRYHFHRVFRAATGQTVGEYVRRRRLSVAASRLVDGDWPIIQIALDAQFESQEAFTRAFKRYFGLTPGAMRRAAAVSDTFTRPLTQAAMAHRSRGMEIEPKYVVIAAVDLVGIIAVVQHQEAVPKQSIGKLWDRMSKVGSSIPNALDSRRYGACLPEPPAGQTLSEGDFVYMAAIAVDPASTGEATPEGMHRAHIPAGRFAVFTHSDGLDKLGLSLDYIFGSWLPNSGLARQGSPDFELYDDRMDESGEFDIYVPVLDAPG